MGHLLPQPAYQRQFPAERDGPRHPAMLQCRPATSPRSIMIKSQLAAAFAVETTYRSETDAVMMIDERLQAAMINPQDVASYLSSGTAVAGTSPPPESARMVVACDILRHVFRPRAALDQICSRVP